VSEKVFWAKTIEECSGNVAFWTGGRSILYVHFTVNGVDLVGVAGVLRKLEYMKRSPLKCAVANCV
jgi:hypothetical protein